MAERHPFWDTEVHSLAEPGRAEVLRAPAELDEIVEFRLATYNVWNLFGPDADSWSRNPDEAAPPEQLRALGNVLVDLEADAVAFQEVQNERVLRSLFSRYVNRRLRRREEDPFDAFVCVPANDPRGINVALATRRAVRATLSFHDYEFLAADDRAMQFSRDLLGIELFVTPAYRLLVFVAHLKSKIGGAEAAARRLRQAQEIRALLEQPVLGGSPYIEQDLVLAGDMNDDPGTPPIEALRGEAPKALEDVLADLDPDHSYPTHDRYEKTRLDYLLVSPSLKNRVVDKGIHREEPTADASDHYPAWVDVRVPGAGG